MSGRISISDSGKFGSQGNGDFFSLQNDGDVARVRMLYDQPDGSDLDYYLCHEIEVDGRKRYVACNGIGDDGMLHTDNCPLCKAGYKRIEKLFLQMYMEEEDKLVVWDRGRNFVPKVQTYINRYGSLVAQPIEIERHGKKGDTNTTYELFPLEVDNSQIEDFPEKQELVGSLILELTEDEMLDVVDGCYTLPNSNNNNNRGGGRTDTPRRSSRSTREEQPARRTQQTSRRQQQTEPEPEKQAHQSEPVEQQQPERRTVRRGRGSRGTGEF